MEQKLERGLRLLYIKKPGTFDTGIASRLPEAYKKFWNEWRCTTPAPVHHIEEPGKWKRNPRSGRVIPVQNVPIPVMYPPEHNKGLWGGEGVIKGFQKRDPQQRRVPHFWIPVLKRSVVYSEVLDKHISTVVTDRTINLIHEHYGFDHYLLKTLACDLKSTLALRLKRKILLSLHNKDLYPDDPTKREEVYNKYKKYLEPYTKEDLEWYGLTMIEAIKKQTDLEEILNKPKPLKHLYRKQLLEKLMEAGIQEAQAIDPEEKTSWMTKMNPFSSKSQEPSKPSS
uniref:39S ribosomal protein L28, mitochondrial n=1 Tax=Timema genevievae TaxID=629358 RepID=A0A7R9JYM8_TIMGE|nr:unnamed protein product [Timema genevievae]